MKFSKIPEHHTFKSIFIRMAISHQVPHAQLFVGSMGSANLALSLAFATYLNCSARQKNDSCGNCSSCMKMEEFIHPDLLLVFPKKSFTFSENEEEKNYLETFRKSLKKNPFLTLQEWINDMPHCDHNKKYQISRKEANKIIQHLSLKPFIGPYKIVLIWLPEYLHNTTSNALLKILEEPPENSIFLLISSNSEKILPTIRSRTQQYIIPTFSEKSIEEILRNKYRYLDEKLYKEISSLSEGNIYKALQLVKQTSDKNFDCFRYWMRNSYSSDFIKLLAQSEEFYKLSIDAQKSFFTYVLQMIRVTLFIKLDYPLIKKKFTSEETFAKKLGMNVTINQLKKIIKQLVQGYYYLEHNANAKIVYTYTSIQIIKIFNPI